MSPGHIFVKTLLCEIEDKRLSHFIKYKRLRKLSNGYSVVTSVLHTMTVSSLFVSIFSLNPILAAVGLSLSVLNALLQGLHTGYSLDHKLTIFFVSQHQYDVLYRDISRQLLKELSESDYIMLIDSINLQLALIRDSSLES